MQIKIIIIGILVACSYLIGEYIYKGYTNRHKQVHELIRILELIRMDLSFGLDTLEEILNDNIYILTNETYLQNSEVDELKKLILTLGKSDIESQARMIQLSIENLKKLTDETESDINKKGMVYKKLSTIMGLIVGIILI